MNHYYKKQSCGQYLGRIILTVCLIVFLNISRADNLTIQLSANQCRVTVSTLNNGCEAGQCAGGPDCVCASKGDHIIWQLTSSDQFKLKFSGSSPLKDNCGKNFKANKQKCVIKEGVSKGQSYSYDIYLQSCANGTDPRIVIK